MKVLVPNLIRQNAAGGEESNDGMPLRTIAASESTLAIPCLGSPLAGPDSAGRKAQADRSNWRGVQRILAQSLLVACLVPVLHGDGPDLAFDSLGNILAVMDGPNGIRLVESDGRISWLSDGAGKQITFEDSLTGIAVDPLAHDVYVSDFDEVFRVSPQGMVGLIAGNRKLARHVREMPNGGIATDVPLHDIVAIAFDSLADTLFVAEYNGRILAVRDGRIRLYVGAELIAGLHSADSGFGPPITDMELAPDGSLYVAARDRIWHVLPGGFEVLPIGLPEFGTHTSESGRRIVPSFPGLVGIAVQGERIYAATTTGEILRVESDGTIERFASGLIRVGRIEFAPSGNLYALSADPSELRVIEVGSDGMTSRIVPTSKPVDSLPQRRIIGGTQVAANGALISVVHIAIGDAFCTGSPSRWRHVRVRRTGSDQTR